jgi:hypothetical protein
LEGTVVDTVGVSSEHKNENFKYEEKNMWNIKVYGPTILFHMHVSHSYICVLLSWMDMAEGMTKSNIEWTVFFPYSRTQSCLLSYVFIDFPSEKGKTLRNGTGEVGKNFFTPLDPLEQHPHTFFTQLYYI